MVEHAILLIGAYELKHSLHIPYKVVLDEAMKLNTHFGATDAHKLINAVMDKLAAELRSVEVEADTGTNYKQKKQLANTEKDKIEAEQHSVEQKQSDINVENGAEAEIQPTDGKNEQNTESQQQPRQPKPRIGLKSKK